MHHASANKLDAGGLRADEESDAPQLQISWSRLAGRVPAVLSWPLRHRRETAAILVLMMMGVVWQESPIRNSADSLTDAEHDMFLQLEMDDIASEDAPFYQHQPADMPTFPQSASSDQARSPHGATAGQGLEFGENRDRNADFHLISETRQHAAQQLVIPPPPAGAPQEETAGSPSRTPAAQIRFSGAINPVP